jgi:aryl-alcohol dehydrogenase-like predicted oxidoreductase
MESFTATWFGKHRRSVLRLGFAGTYRPGRATVYKAIDEGINYFFLYGFDSQLIHALRDVLPRERERFIVATGAYNLLVGHPDIRKTLEKRLRQLGTEYIDVFQFLGVMKPKQMPPRVFEELARLREEGKVRAIGMSCHDRKFAGQVAAEGSLDMLMVRYNAAHRGAEQEIFPYLEEHRPFLVSYTATRWTRLLRRPRGYPKPERVPDAGMCYRFVLTNPNVDVCLTAPSNLAQFSANLAACRQGPLAEDEMAFMRRFGDIVHERHKRFL